MPLKTKPNQKHLSLCLTLSPTSCDLNGDECKINTMCMTLEDGTCAPEGGDADSCPRGNSDDSNDDSGSDEVDCCEVAKEKCANFPKCAINGVGNCAFAADPDSCPVDPEEEFDTDVLVEWYNDQVSKGIIKQ